MEPAKEKRGLFGSRRSLRTPVLDKRFNAIHSAIAQKSREELLKVLKKKSSRTDIIAPDSQDRVPLVMAVQENNATMVLDLLDYYERNGVDINHRDSTGNTALHVACQEPLLDERIILGLLNFASIDVRATNVDGNTPLHYFCERFTSPQCQEYIDLFVRRGADVNASNNFGETLLHKSCLNNSIRIILVNLLIERGANVNKVNQNNEGPLHFAVRMNREDLVVILLKAGADLRIRDKRENKTPLEHARHKRIQTRLRKVEELFTWLDSVDSELRELYGTKFCAEELFLEVLPEVSESLLEKIGVKAVHRLLIIREAKNIERRQASSITSTLTSSIERRPSTHGLTPAVPVFTSSWVLKPGDIEFVGKAGANKDKIGSGTSGKVYRAIFKGKEDVAVKILKPLQSEEQVDEFKKEFDIMCAVQNPYIVHFYGALLEPKLSLVMEFCERDTLYDVLSNDQLDIGWPSVFRWFKQSAIAMLCLHNHSPQQVLHRDFKSLNILMTGDFDCRICDFGLSRFNSETNRMGTLTQMRGTLTHMAPEVCPLTPDTAPTPYTNKCDVYSMGIVLWEVVKRCVDGAYSKPWFSEPNAGLSGPGMELMLMMRAQQGFRPTLEASQPGEPQAGRPPQVIVDLYRACVEPDPNARPDCEQILERLDAIIAMREQALEEWEACRRIRPNLISTEPRQHTSRSAPAPAPQAAPSPGPK